MSKIDLFALQRPASSSGQVLVEGDEEHEGDLVMLERSKKENSRSNSSFSCAKSDKPADLRTSPIKDKNKPGQKKPGLKTTTENTLNLSKKSGGAKDHRRGASDEPSSSNHEQAPP